MKNIKDIILETNPDDMEIGEMLMHILDGEVNYSANIVDIDSVAQVIASLLRVLADLTAFYQEFNSIEELERMLDVYQDIIYRFVVEASLEDFDASLLN